MILEITIPGELPGLNEIIDAAKTHWGGYKEMKETYTSLVRLKCLCLPKLKKPVKITITWHTKDNRRDPDNVMAGQKFILDGIVSAEVIPNDTRRWVKEISHVFPEPDRANPRAEIKIEEEETE